MSFLDDWQLRPFSLERAGGFTPIGLALGKGPHALGVAVVQAPRGPTQADMRRTWNTRLGSRVVPLLLVALYDDKAALCWPGGLEPSVYTDLDPEHVERLCRTALNKPDRHAARRFLSSMVSELGEPLLAIRNEGFLATHQLVKHVPLRSDWQDAGKRAAAGQAVCALSILAQARRRAASQLAVAYTAPGSRV